MPLHLIELSPAEPERAAIDGLLERVADVIAGDGGDVIEAQVTADAKRAFIVAEHAADDGPRRALEAGGVAFDTVDPVRLVGAELEDVKARRGSGRYLVEWDLPADLTMDAYLARKKANAPKYAEVPEATFLRTYVREDVDKCLCFYDGEDADAVRRAREAVEAPIDRFHELEER
ncbi:DUF4242 domain-containing protein [Egibacter rhizosphaerae]|uniref:DUF4242 domain-containing protein n=1 Tax=Egibacter rhizosphaerae TaxID=1670831 RepID=A0A411YE21_9ACTN|nr:DUF4242 domain-containing protein [Egibacter rhizosphaerae]QBI19479.1 DUF4242 domain-containing protein [Egibacter rhizosphaerae]